MSLIVASFAVIDASSCGDISRESPVDNLPTWGTQISIIKNCQEYFSIQGGQEKPRITYKAMRCQEQWSTFVPNNVMITLMLSSLRRLGVEKECLKPTPYRSKTWTYRNKKKIILTNKNETNCWSNVFKQSIKKVASKTNVCLNYEISFCFSLFYSMETFLMEIFFIFFSPSVH